MTKRHIDVIEKYAYPVAAGIEVNVLETYSVLAEMGWDITLHTSKDTLTEKNVLPDYLEHRGIKIKRYKFNWLGYFPEIDWQNTDLVCLHNFNVMPHFYIMLYTWFLKLTGRKKFALIVTPHGGFNPEWSVFSKPVALVKRVYHYTIGSLLINFAVDGVRAVSEWENLEIRSKHVNPKLVKTISNGIEDQSQVDVDSLASDEIKSKVKGFGRYIIQIGRIYPIKNYETTIRALKFVDSDVKFVIAGPIGSYAYEKILQNLIAELGLSDRVVFMGVILGVDKFYLIRHAQMMVHMAIWESFCNVVHEGMSQGLVCLVADNTALPYLVKNDINGWCIPTHDHEQLAKRINFVMENKESQLIRQIEESNREFGREHSWRKVAERMNDFYKAARGSFVDVKILEPRTVSVGIAAYKSEKNILSLIDSILLQDRKGFILTEVIVHCDGNEDTTADKVRKYYVSSAVPIKVVETIPRKGYANSMKEIFAVSASDIVVALNDDIKITDHGTFSKIVCAFATNHNIGMVTGRPVPLPSRTFFGKALASTQRGYHQAQYSEKNRNTAKTADGKIMAFSRSFIRSFKFPSNPALMGNADSYLYFFAITSGFAYRHVYDAVVYSKNPDTIKDYVKFILRCSSSLSLITKTFGMALVAQEYAIPKREVLKGLTKEFIKNPAGLFLIFCVNRYIKREASKISSDFNSTWDPVKTSRQVY